MGRPDYDDSGSQDDQVLADAQADVIGLLQHGQDPKDLETRGL